MNDVAAKQRAQAVRQSAGARAMSVVNDEQRARMSAMQARMATQNDQLRRPLPKSKSATLGSA
jgi:hypothetical protein